MPDRSCGVRRIAILLGISRVVHSLEWRFQGHSTVSAKNLNVATAVSCDHSNDVFESFLYFGGGALSVQSVQMLRDLGDDQPDADACRTGTLSVME